MAHRGLPVSLKNPLHLDPHGPRWGWQSVSQSLDTTTPLAGSTWPTLTLYSGLLSSVLRVSLHLPTQMHLPLSSGRSSRVLVYIGSQPSGHDGTDAKRRRRRARCEAGLQLAGHETLVGHSMASTSAVVTIVAPEDFMRATEVLKEAMLPWTGAVAS
eukprot:scaffold30167_cov53-Phaeocystis_antarctica.AAC.3